MKKILGISLCALFAVSAANAEIASTEWVSQQVGGMDAAATTGEYVKVVSQADGKVSATGASFEKTFNANTDNNAPTSKAVADHVKGAINALDVTAIQGDYIKAVSQADGKVSATAESFADAVTAGGTNAPTAGAVATYVDAKVSNLQGSIDGLGDLASKNKVATGDFEPGAIMNADINDNAAIDPTKIAFSTEQAGALNSGITSSKVTQISTNATNIATNTGNIATNTGNITTLKGRVDGHDASIEALQTSTEGLAALAYKDKVATADIDANAVITEKIADDAVTSAKIADDAVTSAQIVNATIMNADISDAAKIAMSKIDFTSEQTAALDSTIDSTKVDQIATNTNSISDIQNFLDRMINEAEGYEECKTSGDGCTLVLSANGRFSWEKVTREAQ